MAEEQRYLAYLVRLWTVHDNGLVVWSASEEDAHNGGPRRCAFLECSSRTRRPCRRSWWQHYSLGVPESQ